jgi:hypothetical protein
MINIVKIIIAAIIAASTCTVSVFLASGSPNGEPCEGGDEILPLEVIIPDDIEVDRVIFSWWDSVNEEMVDIATVFAPPYRACLDTRILNPGWNQVFAHAYDAEGTVTYSVHWWVIQPSTAVKIYLPIGIK